MTSNKNPLISIIVPIYNVEHYLSRCIDSILSQTYQNMEIILVDDGSKDGSELIADQYAKNHSIVKVIHKKNGGLSSARNAGLKIAKGEWIAFVDSDDYVDSSFLLELYNLATRNNADVATCTFTPFTDDGSALKKKPFWPSEPLSGSEAINDMMKNKRPAYIWLNLFRAELFKKNKIVFPDGRKYEDISTKIMLLYNAKKVAFTNEPLYHYLIHRNSITGEKMTETKCDDYLEAIKTAKSFLASKEDFNSFAYIDYYELCSLFTLLNYFAKEPSLNKALEAKWRAISKRIRKLSVATKYPSNKARIKLLFAASATLSRRAYSALYRSIK